MQWSATCFLLTVMTRGGGGVTKSGIEQFWADDYRIFEQVHGKTSDKEIYGETLPPSITFSRHLNHDTKKDASEKNERFLINYDNPDTDQFDSFSFGSQYSNIFSQHPLKQPSKKPSTSSLNFVSNSNFKPISLNNDPDTYNYLKHLEEFNKEEKYHRPKTVGGFKPYISHEDADPEETDAYKSIQDILEAHEANKEADHKEENDNNSKYLTYPKNKRKKPPKFRNEFNKPRCVSGSCRKRGANYRSRRRPYRWTPSLRTVVLT